MAARGLNGIMKEPRRGMDVPKLITALAVALSLLSSAASSASARREARPSARTVPGIVIFKVKPETRLAPGALAKSSEARELLIRGVSEPRRAFPEAGPFLKSGAGAAADLSLIYFARISPSADPAEVARKIAKLPWIAYAEPKYYQKVSDTPNDPMLANQISALTRMNALGGWTIAKGSLSVVIATVDGGTYWGHEDLSPNLWINVSEDINHNGRFDPGPPPAGDEDGIDQDGNGKVDDVIGWNFSTGTNDPTGSVTQPINSSHGTATASHFGAATNNGKGMAGTSWNCSLLPICAAATSADASIEFGYEGIEYAARMGARVINCSWGRLGGFSQFEQDVIDAAAASGALIVAAAGNDGADLDYSPFYPAAYRNVLAVGATNSADDGKASFSNYGVNVGVFAPGVNIWSALTNSSSAYGNGGSGTSYSSPLVAGLAGILSAQHSDWRPDQIAMQIHVTADSLDLIAANSAFSGLLGRGRVNFARALSEIHAGISLAASRIRTTRGSTLFLPGDTILIGVTIHNLLAPAQNLQFTLSSLDPELEVLQGSASVSSLPGESQVDLPDFLCRVSSVSEAKPVALKLSWVSNVSERDACALRLLVFPSAPLWELQASPATVSLFSVHGVDANVVWASGGSGTALAPVVLRTTDGGTTWSDVTGNLSGVDLFCVDAVDSLRAWVGTGDGRIFATTDGGGTWVAQPYAGTQSPFIDGIRFFDSSNGRAMGDPPAGSSQFVVLTTTNGGSSWTHLPLEPIGATGEAGWNNSFWWRDPLHGWFGTNNARVWRTTDGGASWGWATTPGTNSFGVSFRDNLQGLAIHEGGLIGQTSDGGATWSSVALPSTDVLSSVAYPGPLAWVTSSTSVAESPNDGASWTYQSTYPFDGALNHTSFADTAHGWAVTSNGEILRYTPPGVLGVDPGGSPGVPTEFRLEPNYPNPFNPTTTIRFALAQPAWIELTVFDILGRKVRTIADGFYPATVSSLLFDARGLASGVYFYRWSVRAPDGALLHRETRTMMVLR
jgi:photosystem II stability/assembly factor-like uncharacterized protein